MVHFNTPILGAVALISSASLSAAATIPKRDSSVNEPAFSAPAGSIESTLPSPTPASSYGSSGSYGGSYPPAAGAASVSSSAYESWNTYSAPPPAYSAPPTWSSAYMSADAESASSYVYSSSDSWEYSSSAAPYVYTTSTSSAYMSYSTPSYGSGSSNWNWGSGYQDCVQQCQVQYPQATPPSMPPPAYTAPPSTTTYAAGSSYTPVTRTVVVAPSQGVLRYVPFTTEANPGDVISFQWHAGPHTVTKSSELTPCNKTSDAPFASGQQNASFIFDQTVNDTSTIFYYCGVPTHCEKGMFGIINPPSVNQTSAPSSMSVGAMLPSMAANDTGLMNMWNYVNSMSVGTPAASWGSSYDMSGIDPSMTSMFVENILYSRLYYAQNPSALSSGAGAPSGVSFPADITTFASNNTMTVGNAANSTASASSSATSAAASPAKTNGARGVAASAGGLFAVTAVVAAMMAL